MNRLYSKPPTKEELAVRHARKPLIDVLRWIAGAEDDLDVLIPPSIYDTGSPRLTIREFIQKMTRL